MIRRMTGPKRRATFHGYEHYELMSDDPIPTAKCLFSNWAISCTSWIKLVLSLGNFLVAHWPLKHPAVKASAVISSLTFPSAGQIPSNTEKTIQLKSNQQWYGDAQAEA